MDQAARGSSALASKDFGSAVRLYTDAIAQNPGAVDYYIKRSTAYTRLSPPDHSAAFKDAETALSLASKRAKRELITQSQLRRAITLFGLERYADAEQCLQWVKKLDEKEKSLAIWDIKIKGKLKGLEEGDERTKVTVKEIPEVEAPIPSKSQSNSKAVETKPKPSNGAQEISKPIVPPAEGVQTPASKIRHDWIQTNDSVIITLYCKGIPKDKATVDIKSSSLEVSFPLPTGSDYQFSLDPLFSSIDRMKSYYKIMSTKAEFTLMKSTPGQKWSSIEGSQSVQGESPEIDGNSGADKSDEVVKRALLADKPNPAGPVYPTSSKSGPKDWDKLASDLSKRPKKNAKEGEEDEMEDPGLDEEEGDPTNNFFKMLYKGADADTQRAMMKSYQESNGTALSTNWAEVGKGPVETSPPDGMEAKKWGT
jgi:suppressor of G2 allele of SKP1